MLDSPLRYIVVAAAGPSLMRVSVEARHRNGGNRGSLCTPGINNVSRTMGPRARSTSAQGRESKHSRIYVRLYLPTCPSPVRFVVPREARLYASLLAKYFASTWQKRNRSFTLSRIPVCSTASLSLSLSIYLRIYLSLSACISESNLYHLNFSPRVNSHFFLRKCDCFIVISLSCNNFYIFTRISHVGIDIIF